MVILKSSFYNTYLSNFSWHTPICKNANHECDESFMILENVTLSLIGGLNIPPKGSLLRVRRGRDCVMGFCLETNFIVLD